MNANELADELRNTFSLGEKVTIKQLQKIVITINTLRQLQAENEALKELFKQLKAEPNLPDGWRKLGEMLDD